MSPCHWGKSAVDDVTADRICRDYLEGATIKALHKTHHVNPKRISATLRRRGIEIRGSQHERREIPAEARILILQMWGEGLGHHRIADAMPGTSVRTVRRVLKDAGIRIGPGRFWGAAGLEDR